MAWTDYSSTLANGWDSAIGSTFYDTKLNASSEEFFYRVTLGVSTLGQINSIDKSYNIPGFDDGYQPEGVSNPIAGDFSGSGIPAVRDSYISSPANSVTAWTGTVPSYVEGDLLIAVIMTRSSAGALTIPAGWTQQGTDYLGNIQFSGDVQTLKVFTKVATASEPTTLTWTQASSGRICGFLVSMIGNNFTMGVASEDYGNAATASITNSGADFYINAATWIYASSSPLPYSQSGPGITEINDSTVAQARISGGYTYEDGLVTSNHAAATATNSPNHGMISIPFTTLSDDGGSGGGGSSRPSAGFLYPRGQG